MRHFGSTCSALLLWTTFALPLGEEAPLRGFTAEASRIEREWEAKFRAIPRPDSLREYMKRLAARPQHLGSAYGRNNAEWLRDKFRSWGLDASIETFDVLFPTPKERVLELTGATHFIAKLQEPVIPTDPTTSQREEQLPTYNAYSIDGDVTAPLVFVNYGIPADYEQLEKMGVSVKGAIVIAKYGQSWRGIKPKLAAEKGAIGCIIYSDPHDDGYHAGDVYPKGAYRPKGGVQRGSVMDMPLRAGDPLTPNVGATATAKRLELSQVETLTKIPVLPISYEDAQPLLSAIDGRVAPESWQGGLPITYHVGPGPAQVHLKLQFNWNRVPLYDVIIRIPGTTAANEWIVRGNHRDGWVNGASDPISGQIALMEEARALAALLKQGWQPKRTIIYAAWDGEEEGLIGSTEWAEQHAEDLRQHAAVYINTDASGRGYLGMGGSHSLQRFINGVAKDITDPETNLSAWKRLQFRNIVDAPSGPARSSLRSTTDLRIEALGSGSDFTPFLQHLGIASLNLGFGGEGGDGSYHSIYDDVALFTRFSDTSFTYGRALAQTVGTAVMRLADADILPFEFQGQVDTYGRYLDEIHQLVETKRERADEVNRELAEGVLSAVSDPREPNTLPAKVGAVPYLNLSALENGVAALRASARRFETAFDKASIRTIAGLAELNADLTQTERALTSDRGLPRRPWYQHLLYAPGFYTGYGVKTIPGVREAIEQGNWSEAEEEAVRVGAALTKEAKLLDTAAARLESGAQ